MKVPINQKYMLTITEAAEYFGMGTKVLRKFVADHQEVSIRYGKPGDYPSGRTMPGEGTGEAEGGIRVRQNYDPKRRDRERTVPAGEAL